MESEEREFWGELLRVIMESWENKTGMTFILKNLKKWKTNLFKYERLYFYWSRFWCPHEVWSRHMFRRPCQSQFGLDAKSEYISVVILWYVKLEFGLKLNISNKYRQVDAWSIGFCNNKFSYWDLIDTFFSLHIVKKK